MNAGVHYIGLAAEPALMMELTRAQIRSPKLREVAKQITAKANTGKPAIFKRIQQYLHDRTYHMVRADREEFFGYSQLDDLYKRYGRARVDKSLEVIVDQLNATGRADLATAWIKDKREERVLNGYNVVYDQSVVFGQKRRGKPALQCGDETTVAAALCVMAADTSLDQMIFVGSSYHTLVFVDEGKGKGWLFDSKMLYNPSAVVKFDLQKRLGQVEWLATTAGWHDFTYKRGNLNEAALRQITTKIGLEKPPPLGRTRVYRRTWCR